MEKFIDSKIEITEKKIDEILAIGTSYDLLKRKITIGDKNAVLYFINGFCDEDVMEKVIEALTSVKSEDIPNDKEILLQTSFLILKLQMKVTNIIYYCDFIRDCLLDCRWI